jgi:hypothetical protein
VAKIALEERIADQTFANGKVLPFRDLSEWGQFDEMTRTVKIKKISPVGIFQGHTCLSRGTNTMTATTAVLNVPVREITGDVVICYKDLKTMYGKVMQNDPHHELLEKGEVAQLRLMSPDTANPLIQGYRNYIETYGYSGDLALGIAGLASIPASSYVFTTPWSALSAENVLSAIIEPVTAATQANCTVDFKRLLLPTAAYNQLISRFIPGTSDTLLSAVEKLMSVEKVCGLDTAFGGVQTALYLPAESDPSLFYGNMGQLLIDFFNAEDSIVARGYANVAGAVSTQSGNMIRATGM